MKMHKIYFELDEYAAMGILYRIYDDFGIPEITDQSGEIGFIIELNKSGAKYFEDEYGRYVTTSCDLDQEDGGSYI